MKQKTLKERKKNEFEVSIFQFHSMNNHSVVDHQHWLFEFNNCLSIKYHCSFVSSSEISTKTIRILALNFYLHSIEIASSYSSC